jgi:hypothetical protein
MGFTRAACLTCSEANRGAGRQQIPSQLAVAHNQSAALGAYIAALQLTIAQLQANSRHALGCDASIFFWVFFCVVVLLVFPTAVRPPGTRYVCARAPTRVTLSAQQQQPHAARRHSTHAVYVISTEPANSLTPNLFWDEPSKGVHAPRGVQSTDERRGIPGRSPSAARGRRLLLHYAEPRAPTSRSGCRSASPAAS